MKGKPPENGPTLESVDFLLADKSDQESAKEAIRVAEALAAGVNEAKDLGNTPGNRAVVGHAHDKPALSVHCDGHGLLSNC